MHAARTAATSAPAAPALPLLAPIASHYETTSRRNLRNGTGSLAAIEVAAQGSRAPGRNERELFLDAIRAIAIIRVVAWHAFGAAAITYFVAAMPAMFFVTGSLLAKSMNRRAPRTVLADRFRRLLIPLWAFAGVAWLAMAVAAARTGTDLPLHRAVVWLFPLADPHGSAWEGGWLSSHLWYLRTLVWLLLASPFLLRAVRRAGARVLLVPVAGVFVLDVLTREGAVLAGQHALAWPAGDLVLYSVFLMAGFVHRDMGLHTVSRRGWVVIAVLAAGAATAWRLTQPVPLGVVNNSHPMHLFVGAAWLSVALAGRDILTRIAEGPRIGAAVRAIGRRSLTIYLWHTAAIIVGLNILEAAGIDGPLRAPSLVVLTVVGTVVAVHLFGWVEDLAARRPLPATGRRRAGRLHRPVIALATLAAVTAGVLAVPRDHRGRMSEAAAAATRSPRRPPVPSQPPPPPTFAAEPATEGAGEPITVEATPRLAPRLDAMLTAWLEHSGAGGAMVGIDGPSVRWKGAGGSRPDTSAPVSISDRIELASLTKLFTATLVHRFVEAGQIDLGAPLPPVRSLPDFPYDQGITVAQLLDHSSGLINYLDPDLYAFDPTLIDDPVSAVMAVVAHPLAADPGTTYLYSSTNFLVLGLLLEDVSSRSFGDLLRDTLFGPLKLDDTVHLPPAPGWPRGATSGIETSLDDLLTAGTAILRDHVGMSAETFAHMADVDPTYGYGPGTFGFCPCRLDSEGNPRFFAIGYYGATTLLGYVPTLDLTVAVDLADSLGVNGGYDAVTMLFEMIEDVVRSS
ncbi:MAG: serine hydrolase [Acidimicrobiales bacterium]|nr:serine hydrolase [Acidimicrobiales bacterium]